MLARNGRRDEARAALARWVEEASEDALVEPAQRAAARLDLALLWIQDGRPRRAREILTAMADEPYEPVRRLCLLAGAAHAEGRPRAALDAAERAERTARAAAARGERAEAGALPVVQQAVLHEEGGDTAAARDAWRRVVEGASGRNDLAALIQAMRARIVLERTEHEGAGPDAADSPGDPKSDPESDPAGGGGSGENAASPAPGGAVLPDRR